MTRLLLDERRPIMAEVERLAIGRVGIATLIKDGNLGDYRHDANDGLESRAWKRENQRPLVLAVSGSVWSCGYWR